MPLWLIYHPPNTFETEAVKSAFAKEITGIYTAVPLPAFYVNVIFQSVQPSDYYIGGVPRPSTPDIAHGPGPDSSRPWIRIVIQNIARKIPDNAEARNRFLEKVDKALKPFVEDMGYDWEYSVEETDRNLWKIQGLAPPMPKSEAELEWIQENKPVPFDEVKGGLL